MALLSPFPLSYAAWLGIFVLLPLVLICAANPWLKGRWRIFLYAIIGSVIFSYPWDIIAVGKGIWLFKQPYIAGIWILGLPIEEWLFMALVTSLFVAITLVVDRHFAHTDA